MKTERLGNLEQFFEGIKLRGTYQNLHAMPTKDMVKKWLEELPVGGMLALYWNNPYGVHAICNGDFGIAQGDSAQLSKIRMMTMLEEIRMEGGAYAQLEGKWFYPYPTVEFPVALFSDDHLPQIGECDDNRYNFQDAALELFDEREAVDHLLQTGQYPFFAHAYMLVLTMDGEQSLKLLPDYTRFSNERRQEMQIRTDVYKDRVTKGAFTYMANQHILDLGDLAKKLESAIAGLSVIGQPIALNTITAMDEAAAVAQFAYVEGESLESRLDLMVANGEASAAAKLMLNFVSRLRSLPTLVPFESSYEFRRWFGDISEDKIRCLDEAGNELPVMSLPVTDIDMIPQNIMLTDEKAILIDYEWTFSCAVPVDYVVFRFLYYFLEGKHRLQYKHPEFENLYRQAGITESVKQFFLIMETHFQEYVQQSAMVLRNEYEMFGKPLIRRWQLQSLLMGSTGHAITVRYPSQHEEVISSIPMDRSDLVDGNRRQEVYHYKIPVTENGEMILILPSVRLLRIGILSVSGGRSREQEFLVNGDLMAGCVYSFENPEPKISVDVSTNQAGYLMLSLEEIAVSKDAYGEISSAINDYKFLAENRDKQLEALKSSTSWKLTKPLRALKKEK
ncbi:MAG: hypothetical protein K6E18_01540 [Lachnospiraceae bacterium]|nr:hypothetical protein [Lachnospiraceae bacterium]